MFNGFRVGQVLQTKTEAQKQRITSARKRQLVLKKREEMTSNYDGRVHNFMMAAPIELHDPLTSPSQSRTFKGSARLILNGFPNERKRVEREVARNQFLDLEPILVKHNFREDDPAKRLHGRMHFGPLNTLDRLRDVAKYPNIVRCKQLEQRYVPSPGQVQSPNFGGKSSRVSSPSYSQATMSPKDIYPSLHKKTHFNAIVSSLTLQSLQATRKSSPALPTSNQTQFSRDSILKHGNFSKEEAESVAHAVLETCHVKRKAPEGFLRCGGGRLVGNPDTTVGEVYSRLGNSSSHSVTPVIMRAGLLV